MRAASKDKRKALRKFRDLARVRQKGLCFYCQCAMAVSGSEAARARPETAETIEHRRPRARGGSNAAANLVLTCRACNSAKATMNEQEFLARLRADQGATASIPA